MIELNRGAALFQERLLQIFFGETNLAMIAASLGISLFSLVRGSVNYIKQEKNGHLGMVGQIILSLYYSVSCIGRLSFIATMSPAGSYFMFILPSVPLVHLLPAFILLSRSKVNPANNSRSRRLLHCLSTMASPPLFDDWEDVYR